MKKELLDDFKRVSGKTGLLFRLAEAALNQPDGVVREVVYPVVGEQTLKNLVKEFKFSGNAYRSWQSLILETGKDGSVKVNPEPTNLARLKTEIERCWPMTSLLDMLKETDLRVNFTQHFKSVATRDNLDLKVLQKRLLICLYGLGTHTGIRRLSSGLLG